MKENLFCAILGLSLFMASSPQQSLATEVVYSAESLPQDSNPAWIKNISIHTDPINDLNEAVANGILDISASVYLSSQQQDCFTCHMSTSPHNIHPETNTWLLSYAIEDENLCHSAGTVLEARIKVDSGEALGLAISDGHFKEKVLIAAYAIKLFNPDFDLPALQHVQDFSDDFHIIKVILKDGTSNVFVDNNLVISSTTLFTSTDRKVEFGVDTHLASASLDYVKYSTLGDENSGCIENLPPVVDAGENRQISTEQMDNHALIGTVTDENEYDYLQCRWLTNSIPLHDWRPVAANGECILPTEEIDLPMGTHIMTLEASDGVATSSDDMILTVDNSAPHIALTGAGVYHYGDPISIAGFVSDFDGDQVVYIIIDDGFGNYCYDSIDTIIGGAPAEIPACIFEGVTLGYHLFQALVYDGVNEPVTTTVELQVIDSTAPTLAPVTNKTILWPANHELVDIQIVANASDDSGLPVQLTASVTSDEAVSSLGSGDTAPDWTPVTINQDTGEISLQLRAERSGSGDGRTYEVTIVAQDAAGNSSTATVQIIVPHDKRSK